MKKLKIKFIFIYLFITKIILFISYNKTNLKKKNFLFFFFAIYFFNLIKF